MKPLPEPRRGEPIRAQDEAEKVAYLRRGVLRSSSTIGVSASLSGTRLRELKQTKIALVKLTVEWSKINTDGWYRATCSEARFHVGTGQPVLDTPAGNYHIVTPEPIGTTGDYLLAFWDNNTGQYIAISAVGDICCDSGFEDDKCCPPGFEEPPCSCGGTCGSCSGGGSGGGNTNDGKCIVYCYDYCTCQQTSYEYNFVGCNKFAVDIIMLHSPQGTWQNSSRRISIEEYLSGAYANWLINYLPIARVCFIVHSMYGPPPISPFDLVPCTGQFGGTWLDCPNSSGAELTPGGGAAITLPPGIGPMPPGSSTPPTVPPSESCLAYWERICAEAHGAGTPGYFDCVNRSVSVCKSGGRTPTGIIRPASVEDWHDYFEGGFDGLPLPEPTTLAAASEAAGPTNTVTATLTANVNDFNPGPCRILAVTTDGNGSKTITGVSIGQRDGQWLIIENFSALDNVVLVMENTNSMDHNRFNNGSSLTPITIAPGGVERFIYTSRINRWRRV
jgi:hypothetical protein